MPKTKIEPFRSATDGNFVNLHTSRNSKLAFCWNVFAVLVVAAFAVRLLGSVFLGKNFSALFLALIALPLLLYVLFLLEGAQVAALKLKGMQGFEVDLKNYTITRRVSAKRSERILVLFHLFDRKFFAFIIGRQFLVIASVVLIAFLIDQIVYPLSRLENGPSPQLIDIYDWGGLLNSQFITFLIATVIPYWLSQLLSQFIANYKPMSFLCLPLAYNLILLTVWLDKLGIGIPAISMDLLLNLQSDRPPEQ